MTHDELLLALDIPLERRDALKKALSDYADLLSSRNKEYNLTAIVEPNEVTIKHFYDSLYPLRFLDLSGKSALDFGSGAGFPGLLYALFVPDCRMSLLDATAKKCHFLEEASTLLKCNNVSVLHARGEDLPRGSFDVGSARAVAALPVLLELVMPLLKVGGKFLALKGKNGQEELSESETALRKLGGKLLKIEEYALPEDMGERTAILIEKVHETPHKYPRPYGEILKRPL